VKILLLGSGGREHALAWKLLSSRSVSSVLVAPGNPGIAASTECAPCDITSPQAVVALAKARAVDLVVVGPEAPLVVGVADALRTAGVAVFGPDAQGAKLEGSKSFAKEIMREAGVPTARFETFTDAAAAAQRAQAWGSVVVKADGLAAGKGVVVAESGQEAAQACLALGALPAGHTLVLEERLMGPELSVMALCDGTRFSLLAPSQDHKRVFEGDRGPNTGGMGAYAPANLITASQLEDIGERIIRPTLVAVAARGCVYRGALYAGLMLTDTGPKVIEFNARLGDPETQVLMMQLDEDLALLLAACAQGTLDARPLRQKPGASVGVVVAAQGYPERPVTGDLIELPTTLTADELLFHAGTTLDHGVLKTSGGRVVTAAASAPTVAQARARAIALASRVTFRGRHFRADIAAGAV
jgi:phosphoribosylamine---glycine ligase